MCSSCDNLIEKEYVVIDNDLSLSDFKLSCELGATINTRSLSAVKRICTDTYVVKIRHQGHTFENWTSLVKFLHVSSNHVLDKVISHFVLKGLFHWKAP